MPIVTRAQEPGPMAEALLFQACLEEQDVGIYQGPEQPLGGHEDSVMQQ